MPVNFRFTLTLLTVLFAATFVDAQTYSWTGGDGFWDEAENWQPHTPSLPDVPNFLAIADIAHNDTTDREITFRRGLNGTNPVYFLRHLMLGNAGSGNTIFVMSEYDGVIPGTEDIPRIDPHELTTTRPWVGNNGDGVVEMTGGTLNVTQGISIGNANNSGNTNTGLLAYHGEVRMSGGDLHLFVEGQPSQPLIDISAHAAGTFTQTGGHVHALDDNTAARVRIGLHPFQVVNDGPAGRYDLQDGILEASNLEIGIGQRGEFIQSGGIAKTPVANLNGTTEITGGFFDASIRTNLAQDMTLTLAGDFVLQTNPPVNPVPGSMTTPELNLDGAMLSAQRFIANGGSLTVTGDHNRITAETSLNGSTITNNGVLEFAGDTSFNGTVIEGTGAPVNLGEMTTGFANIDQAFTNTGNLFINSGSSTDSVMVFMNQTFTQASTGRLVMSALDPISFTSYDSISFSEQAHLNGTFELVLEEGFNPIASTTLTLFNFAGDFSPETGLTPRVSGSFETLVLPELVMGLSWDASQLNSLGSLTIVGSPVPEPASTALLLSGIIAGCVISRRRPRTKP